MVVRANAEARFNTLPYQSAGLNQAALANLPGNLVFIPHHEVEPFACRCLSINCIVKKQVNASQKCGETVVCVDWFWTKGTAEVVPAIAINPTIPAP